MLYNISIGATANDLQWVYENDKNFNALPALIFTSTFRLGKCLWSHWVCFQIGYTTDATFPELKNFRPKGPVFDAERFAQFHRTLPTSGKLIVRRRIAGARFKKRMTVINIESEIRDENRDLIATLSGNAALTFFHFRPRHGFWLEIHGRQMYKILW